MDSSNKTNTLRSVVARLIGLATERLQGDVAESSHDVATSPG
jgi:hypothetical protein